MVADRTTAAAVGLVVTAVATLQFGAGFAATLFDELGPGGTAFLRLAIAAAIMVAILRPRVAARRPRELAVAAAFGLTLGAMNWAIYTAMDHIPLGIAVTLEFIGPLGLAVANSHRALDVLWVALAAAGVLLLAGPTGDLDTAGVTAALTAGALWAAYILLSARTGRIFPGASGLALALVAGALLVAPAGIAQGGTGCGAPSCWRAPPWSRSRPPCFRTRSSSRRSGASRRACSAC